MFIQTVIKINHHLILRRFSVTIDIAGQIAYARIAANNRHGQDFPIYLCWLKVAMNRRF